MIRLGHSVRSFNAEVISALDRGVDRLIRDRKDEERNRFEVRKWQLTEARELRGFISQLEASPEVLSLRRYLGQAKLQFPLHDNGWVAGWRFKSVKMVPQISGSLEPSVESSPYQLFRRYAASEIRRLEICSQGICVFSYDGDRLALESRRFKARTLPNMWGARLCGVDPVLLMRSVAEVIATVLDHENSRKYSGQSTTTKSSGQ